jgi:BolA protein
MNREELIRNRLNTALSPENLEIIDRSHEHAGHEGAKGGGGHFDIIIISAAFNQMSTVQRHRAIYDALGDAMKSEIHALSIKAYTPEEF